MMNVDPTASSTAFFKYDNDTRCNQTGEVQHWASARNNLVRVPLDVLDAINPTNNFIAAGHELAAMATTPAGAVLAGFFAPFRYIGAFFAELAELIGLPLFILKDLLDAGVHTTCALANGRPEGEEVPLTPKLKHDRYFSPTLESPGPKLVEPSAGGVAARAPYASCTHV